MLLCVSFLENDVGRWSSSSFFDPKQTLFTRIPFHFRLKGLPLNVAVAQKLTVVTALRKRAWKKKCPEKTGEVLSPKKIPYPIGSLYGILCIFAYICLFFMVDVGKYTSPMDPHGIWIRVFFCHFKSRPESLELHLESSKSTNFLKPKFQPPSKSLQNFTGKPLPPQKNLPKKEIRCVFFFPQQKKSLNFWGFLPTSGRRRGGHVQSTNAGLLGEGWEGKG